MSSTPRYQSHFFKTVQSQFQQLQNKMQVRWRQLKAATAWGAQLGLYPFYVIFQAGRWGGRVFKYSAAQGVRALSAALGLEPVIEVDQPVQNILEALELQPFPTTTRSPLDESYEWQISLRPATSPQQTWRKKLEILVQNWRRRVVGSTPFLAASALMHSPPTFAIQGIASSLSGRQLVLVAAENQILDILEAKQQRQLHQRIIWEVANALRSHHQRHCSKPLPFWQSCNALPINVRPQMSFPIRGIHRLMAWMQRQPLAPRPVLPTSQMSPQPSALPIFSLVPLRQTWVRLHQSLRTPLNPLPETPTLLKRVSSPLVPPHQSWGERIALRARALFAARQSASLTLTSATPDVSQVAPRLAERIGQWLQGHRSVVATGVAAIALLPFTVGLPEPAQAAAAPALPMPVPQSLPIEWRVDPSRLRKRSKEETDIEGLASQSTQGKVRVPLQKSPKPLSAQTSFESAIADWANRFSQTTVSSGSPAIEIDAIFMGYDWHPLKQLLLSLDRGIAWMETQLAQWWPIIRTQAVQLWQRWWPIIRTQTVQLWQRWWPVIQTQLIQLWRYWSPIVQKALLFALNQSVTWLKQQSIQLGQRGVSAIRNWIAR